MVIARNEVFFPSLGGLRQFFFLVMVRHEAIFSYVIAKRGKNLLFESDYLRCGNLINWKLNAQL